MFKSELITHTVLYCLTRTAKTSPSSNSQSVLTLLRNYYLKRTP